MRSKKGEVKGSGEEKETEGASSIIIVSRLFILIFVLFVRTLLGDLWCCCAVRLGLTTEVPPGAPHSLTSALPL